MRLWAADSKNIGVSVQTPGKAILALLTAAVLTLAMHDLRGQETQTVWDGVYTEEQATSGAAVYHKACAFCHQDDLTGDQFSAPLVGRGFLRRWQEKSVSDLLTF